MFFNFKNLKTRPLYKNIALRMLLLSFIPLLLFALFSYNYTRDITKKLLNEQNATHLKQTINTVEVVVNQVNHLCAQMVLDSTFKQYETFANGAYYQELSSAIPEADIEMLQRYITAKASILDKISVFKLSNDFVHSVYFYDHDKQIIFTDNNTELYFHDFKDKEWFRIADNVPEWPVIMDTRMIQKNGVYSNVLTLAYRSFNKDGNMTIVNLDADKISKVILSFAQGNKGVIAAVSSDNRIMLSNKKELLYADFSEFIETEQIEEFSEGEFVKRNFDTGEVLVTNITSDLLKWKFFMFSDIGSVYRIIVIMFMLN